MTLAVSAVRRLRPAAGAKRGAGQLRLSRPQAGPGPVPVTVTVRQLGLKDEQSGRCWHPQAGSVTVAAALSLTRSLTELFSGQPEFARARRRRCQAHDGITVQPEAQRHRVRLGVESATGCVRLRVSAPAIPGPAASTAPAVTVTRADSEGQAPGESRHDGSD